MNKFLLLNIEFKIPKEQTNRYQKKKDQYELYYQLEQYN